MSEKSKYILPQNSWYLSIAGVAPALKRKKLGKTLIQLVLAKTDKIGAQTYLEPTHSKIRVL